MIVGAAVVSNWRIAAGAGIVGDDLAACSREVEASTTLPMVQPTAETVLIDQLNRSFSGRADIVGVSAPLAF
jgi:hypothetical protein